MGVPRLEDGRGSCLRLLVATLAPVVMGEQTSIVSAGGTSITGCLLRSLRISFWPPTAQNKANVQLAEMWMQVADSDSDWTSATCTPSVFNGGAVTKCSKPMCFTGFRMQLTGPATYKAINWHLEGKTADSVATYFTVSEGTDLTVATKSTMSSTTTSTYATFAVGFCAADQMCNKGVTDAKYWLPTTVPTFAEWNLLADLQFTNFPYKEITAIEARAALASFLSVDQDVLAIKSIQQEASGISAWSLTIKVLIWIFVDIAKTPGLGKITFDEQTQFALQKSADFGYSYVSMESARIMKMFSDCQADGSATLMQSFKEVMPLSKAEPNPPSLLVSISVAKDYTKRTVQRPGASVKMSTTNIADVQVSIPAPENKWEPLYRVHSSVAVTMANEDEAYSLTQHDGQEAVQKGIAKYFLKSFDFVQLESIDSLNSMLPTGFVNRRLDISSIVRMKFFVPCAMVADAINVARTLSAEAELETPSVGLLANIQEFAQAAGLSVLATDVVRDATWVEVHVPKLSTDEGYGSSSALWFWDNWLIWLAALLLIIILCVVCCLIWGHMHARRRVRSKAQLGKQFVDEEHEVQTRGVHLAPRQETRHLPPDLMVRQAHVQPQTFHVEPERQTMVVQSQYAAPPALPTTLTMQYAAPPAHYKPVASSYAPLSTNYSSALVTRESVPTQNNLVSYR